MSRPAREKRPPVAADGTELEAPRVRKYVKKARASEDGEARGTASASEGGESGGGEEDVVIDGEGAGSSSQIKPASQEAVQSRPQSLQADESTTGADVVFQENEDDDLDIDLEHTPAPVSNGTSRTTNASSSVQSPLQNLDPGVVSRNLSNAQCRVMDVLVGGMPPAEEDGAECLGLQDQWRALRSTLRGTLQGEGNSALLVGAPGSGKSLLINSVLRSLSSSQPFHVVHLDAALQTTDRLSMRELARQLLRSGAIKPGSTDALDLELEEEEDEEEEDVVEEAEDHVEANGTAKDTATAQDDGEDDELEGAVLSSLANTTSAILTLLSSGDASGRPLIIVLSSFELLTARPRQALLYVLLDAVQAGSYMPGLCVLGTTSRVDTSDLLEKRVRSRFSGRLIDVWPGAAPWPVALRKALMLGCTGDVAFDEAYKADIDAAVSDSRVTTLLEEWESTSNDFASLYKAVIPVVASLTPGTPSIHAALVSSTASTAAEYSALNDLTTPEFALLIAAKQLLGKDREVFNFAMCFEELKQFVARIERDRMGASTVVVGGSPAQQRSIGVSWTGLRNRPRVLMAFRSLLNLELFQPDSLLTAQTDAAALTSTTTAGTRRSRQAVGTEFLRVRCTIFPQTIVEAARSKSRIEPLGMHLVQWAQASG